MAESPQSRIVDRLLSPEMGVGAIALITFILVLWVYPQPIGVARTWFPILMGLLGSSVFILYDIVKTKRAELASLTVVRLLLGPIAGWLAYAMVASQFPDPMSESGQTQAPALQERWIWLPFLAGFSSDLLVGIVNQAIRAIKLTLGIDRPPEYPDTSSPSHPAKD